MASLAWHPSESVGEFAIVLEVHQMSIIISPFNNFDENVWLTGVLAGFDREMIFFFPAAIESSPYRRQSLMVRKVSIEKLMNNDVNNDSYRSLIYIE